MTVWHVLIGISLGLIATVATIVGSRRQILSSNKSCFEYYTPPNEKCVICLDNMSNDEMGYLPCGHGFHEKCLKDLRKSNCRKCPTCRYDI